MNDAALEPRPGLAPLCLRDAPAFIERQFPVGRLSAEAFKERDAKQAQTLTALGSYWKGRKPLILVRAVVLGCLLPATDDLAADLDIFLKLMAMDDAAFGRRFDGSAVEFVRLFPSRADGVATNRARVWRTDGLRDVCMVLLPSLRAYAMLQDDGTGIRRMLADAVASFLAKPTALKPKADAEDVARLFPDHVDSLTEMIESSWRWRNDIPVLLRQAALADAFATLPYAERLEHVRRPEECDDADLIAPIWLDVNAHLGTDAASIPEFVEQLGIARFGHLPRVADTFCGAGSIPFEAARIGCDVYASDLNPVACMLTWAAFNVIGASPERRAELEAEQTRVTTEVSAEIARLCIEHDANGNRAKSYLYCLETRCPRTGWMVPVAPTWVIFKTRNVIAKLVLNPEQRRYHIVVVTGVSEAELKAAEQGTLRNGRLVHPMNSDRSGVEIRTIRGDSRDAGGIKQNNLRPWEKCDVGPRLDDIWQERLYAIQWIKKESLAKGRQKTFYATVTEEDVARETKAADLAAQNVALWQSQGCVPDMAIETGKENEGPIRTNGWTYWHHLFVPRALVTASIIARSESPFARLMLAKYVDYNSKSCRWAVSQAAGEQAKSTFDSQALKTMFSWANRAVASTPWGLPITKPVRLCGSVAIDCVPASQADQFSDIHINDPPYADAVRYEEITEFFIAWLRKNPPRPFDQWTWDSRRDLAIKGRDEQFRRDMVAAYANMTSHMPDHGQQVVMFTHQDAGVWADLGAILWAAGLRVTAAWNIVTETESALKAGNYVQGTVCLVLRKRLTQANARRMEIEAEIETAVAEQLARLNALDDAWHARAGAETLYTDGDLTLAAYAAALQVVTAYSTIDRQPLDRDLYRKLAKKEHTMLRELIDYAASVANTLLVPEGFPNSLWRNLAAAERFYVRMLDMEAQGSAKVADFQAFARSFAFADYAELMASTAANAAALAGAADLKGRLLGGDGFAASVLRQVLFAVWKTMESGQPEPRRGLLTLKTEYTADYWQRRQTLIALADYVALKTVRTRPAESAGAQELAEALRNDRV